MVQMGSKEAQKMQNHTEQVPKPLKISDSGTTKKNIFGVGFFRGKPKARSELSWPTKGAQKMQNHTEQVPKPLKIS